MEYHRFTDGVEVRETDVRSVLYPLRDLEWGPQTTHKVTLTF